MEELIVYTMPTCGHCHKAKDFLDEKGVSYREIDVTRDEDAYKRIIEKTGQDWVPVFEIGSEFIVGFNKEKLSKRLGIDN